MEGFIRWRTPPPVCRQQIVPPVEDIARRVVARVMRQVESGADTEPGEVIPTWLREGASTPARTGTAVD